MGDIRPQRGRTVRIYRATVGGDDVEVRVEDEGGTLKVELGGIVHRVDAAELLPGCYSVVVDGKSHDVVLSTPPAPAPSGGLRWALLVDGEPWEVDVRGPSRRRTSAELGRAASGGAVHAPMPGLIVAVCAPAGSGVAPGQPLVIMEAMKMQMEIRAPHEGTVLQVHVAPGQEVRRGQILVSLG